MTVNDYLLLMLGALVLEYMIVTYVIMPIALAAVFLFLWNENRK